MNDTGSRHWVGAFTSEEDILKRSARRSNADNQAGRGDDTVIRAQHRSTKPADAMRSVRFMMTHKLW